MSSSNTPIIENQIPAPINRLFVEILTCIFHMCVLEGGDDRYFVHDTKVGPWKLGHVCSLWRRMANNTPSLWTRLSVGGFGWDRAVRDPVSMFVVALKRSACLNLDLELHPSDRYPLEVQGEIIRLAITQSHRWEHVLFHLNSPSVPLFSEIGKDSLDHLSSLVIYCYEGGPDDYIDAFRYAPALQTVYLHGNYNGARFEFPWNNLLEFFDRRELGDPASLRCLLDTINQCTNLRTLYVPILFTAALGDHLPSPLNPPFVQDSLRVLTACEGVLIRSLVLPQLEKMWLTPDEYSYELCHDDGLPSLLDLIHRSQCSLTSLELNNVIFTDLLIDVLHLTPRVQTLKICTSDWQPPYNAIFRCLINHLAFRSNQAAQAFLPLVRNLDITIEDLFMEEPCSFVDHTFFDMVHSRWNSGVLKVTKLNVSEPGADVTWDLTLEHITQFRGLKDDGLDIEVAVSRRGSGPGGVHAVRTRYV
ncbi:hypothetical protein EV421DRAFT_2041589 [Armillaria borealis]|uniref:F-box domain-containing protein n=1 Tax=Armillaria borealis TaxID=47425 RepID=A0AA39MEH6_9AGAR|nr:hypothetical protein EV421DRAFT_2041589 [Armillaria borealis]